MVVYQLEFYYYIYTSVNYSFQQQFVEISGLCLIQMCLQNSQEKLQVLAGVTMVVGGTFIATFITVQSIMTFVNASHTKDFVCEEP